MASFKIPGTQVAARILQPDHPPFCEIFYQNSPADSSIMGSVNAGTSYSGSLFEVSLDGIIGAFYGILSVQQNFVGRHPYQKVHKELFMQAGEAQNLASYDLDTDSPVQFAMMQRQPEGSPCVDYDGTVFIDVFKDHLRPYQVDANYAMIYVVPPLGDLYDSPDDFIRAVEATAENMVLAVMTYNKECAGLNSPGGLQLFPINTIRTCLFSGGYFNTFQLKHERIATAIFQGITNALYSRDTSIRNIDFENNFYEEGLKDEGKGKQEFDAILSLLEPV